MTEQIVGPGETPKESILDQLVRTRTELNYTSLVAGILAKQILKLTNGNRIEISDQQLAAAQHLNMTSWRDERRHTIVIEVQ